jgi:hypothetical protein
VQAQNLGKTLRPQRRYVGIIQAMDNELCTAADQAAIIDEAARRRAFLLWLADRLEQSDMFDYRAEAAQALRQLVSTEDTSV